MLTQAEIYQLLSYTPFRGRVDPEALLSMQVANDLRVWSMEKKLHCVWFKVPNEGHRTKAQNALLRAMGLIPGVYDFTFLSELKNYCIELKVGKNGLEPRQKLFGRWCAEYGVPTAVCKSRDEVMEALCNAGLLIL